MDQASHRDLRRAGSRPGIPPKNHGPVTNDIGGPVAIDIGGPDDNRRTAYDNNDDDNARTDGDGSPDNASSKIYAMGQR